MLQRRLCRHGASRAVCVVSATGAARALSAFITSTPLNTNRKPRQYGELEKPIPMDLVPEGQSTSRFQTNAPAKRKRILKRHLLAPQATEPLVAITVGVTNRTRAQLEQLRRELPAALASAVEIDERDIKLGPCRSVPDHGGFLAPAMPNTTSIDPQPRWVISVYIDETTYDVEDIALLGHELFLTVLEGSHEPLRALGVAYAEPPQPELESVVDEIDGEAISLSDYAAVETEINERLHDNEMAEAANAAVGGTGNIVAAVPAR
uniref:Uncharacterized protein n=1 Tax=Neobodo designis TaxID=312471 RepID=A0A7S1LMA5_NEODS|mmetsp:Transcript_249/g.972  ORF Transcript_249/g.972 Transcript_249/m.972 type:complete len:264 (+) Transcript_249:35-826(+)